MDKDKRIKELSDLIIKHKDLYYNHLPEISDAGYDALEDMLRDLDPEHPTLKLIGAPVKDE